MDMGIAVATLVNVGAHPSWTSDRGANASKFVINLLVFKTIDVLLCGFLDDGGIGNVIDRVGDLFAAVR